MKRLIKRSICAVLTLCLMFGMFSCTFMADAAADDATLASLTRDYFTDIYPGATSNLYVKDFADGVFGPWIVTGDDGSTFVQEKGRTIVTSNATNLLMTSVDDCYLDGGFKFIMGTSAPYLDDGYIMYYQMGDLKFQTTGVGGTGCKFELFDGETLIAYANYTLSAAQYPIRTFTYSDGKITLVTSNAHAGTTSWTLADGTSGGTTLDISDVNVNGKIVLFKNDQSTTSTQYPYWGFDLTGYFPYKTIDSFNEYLEGVNMNNETEVARATYLRDWAIDGNTAMDAALSPVGGTCNHEYSFTETVAPTCTDEGYDAYTCSLCNRIIKENKVDALGHDYSVFVETVAPTYEAEGYTVYKCSHCDKTENRDFVDKLIQYSEWSITSTVGGTVFIDGAAVDTTAAYPVGTTVTLTVQADEEYGFVCYQDGNGNIISKKSTYELEFSATTTVVAVFSDEIDTILDSELAGLTNTMIDGYVSGEWTLVGDNNRISIDSSGNLVAHHRGGQTATNNGIYSVSSGFTLSGNFDFTGKGFDFNDSYIKVGSMKVLIYTANASSPAYIKVYNGDTELATSLEPIATQYNAYDALNKFYSFTVDENGLLTVLVDGEKVSFGTTDNTVYTVDVSDCNFDSASVIVYQGWNGDPGSGYAYHSGIKFYSSFPYSTVAEFQAFLSGLNKSTSLATINSAKALYQTVMDLGSEMLQAEIEPYYSYITAAESLTWADVDVLSDDNGTLLIDDAAYDATATLTAGETHTVTAVPNDRYNFVAFVDADGNVISTDTTYEFVASADTYIRATYIAKVYSVWSFETSEGGKVLIDGADVDTAAEYEVGTTAELTAVPDEGYVFLYWENVNGEIVATSDELGVIFENETYYKAIFSNDPNAILDYELSTIRDIIIDGYLAEDWTITNGGNNGYSKIEDGNLYLSARQNSTATTNLAYDLSTGFNLSGHFDFHSRGHSMGDSPYISVGNLKIQFYITGVGNPVYINVIDTATSTTLATSAEAVSDTFTSDLMNADIDISVDFNGKLTVKHNGKTVTWGDTNARTVDVSSVDLSASKVVIFLNWVSSSDSIVNTFNNFSLTQSIPFATVSDFQSYIDNVDTDDKAALAKGIHLVSVVKANGSAELVSKIDDFNFYKAKYDIGTSYGGTVQANGVDFVNDYRYLNRLAVGTVLNLTATPDAGYTFAYWADETGAVKSYDNAITVILGDKATTVSAVFTKDTASDGETVTIFFTNRSGKVVSEIQVVKGTEVTLPELSAASSYGYTVNGWVVNGEIVTSGTVTADKDMIITADYTKTAGIYTVEVIGSENNVDGKYSYNDKITITFDLASLSDGEYFGGWCNENGTVVSYAKSYTFYVGADVTLNAVIDKLAVEDVPAISVTDASLIENGRRASFLTERYLPEGYTFVTAGVIYTVSDYTELTLDAVDGSSIRSRAVSSMNACGQYRQTIGSSTGATLNVSLAAYLTYVDADGNMNTIYSSTYSLTINQ